ncbi:MAG: HlyD family efflux transporter periplasmic adaptor subunit, partial [Pseudomonadota bacterium]
IKSKQAELATRQSELTSLLEAQGRESEEDKVRVAAAKSAAEKAARKAEVDESVYAGLEYRKLLEDRNVTAELYQRELSRLELVERVRASKRAELEADIRRLESEVKAAQSELDSFTIRAPRDGLVVVGTNQQGQKLDVNDSVNPGLTVVELIDDSNLIIEADIPEFAAARLAQGQPAEVTIDAAGGRKLTGKVLQVASIVRRQSRFSQAMVRGITVELDDDPFLAELRPGMTSKITLTVDTERQVLAVPESAIIWRSGQPGVTVKGGGWQPITLGRTSGGLRIVLDGLEAGTEVAI